MIPKCHHKFPRHFYHNNTLKLSPSFIFRIKTTNLGAKISKKTDLITFNDLETGVITLKLDKESDLLNVKNTEIEITKIKKVRIVKAITYTSEPKYNEKHKGIHEINIEKNKKNEKKTEKNIEIKNKISEDIDKEKKISWKVYGEPTPLSRHMVSRGHMYNPSAGTYMCIFIYIHTYTLIFVQIYVCVYMYICTYMNTLHRYHGIWCQEGICTIHQQVILL
jgi:hypothetical protein